MAETFTDGVFLTYSSHGRAVVRPIAERLKADGLRVWFDEWGIKPDESLAPRRVSGWGRPRSRKGWSIPACHDGTVPTNCIKDANRPSRYWERELTDGDTCVLDPGNGSCDFLVRLSDSETGRCLQVLEGHTSAVATAARSTDGRRAFSGHSNGGIWGWNLAKFVTDARAPRKPNTQ